MRMEFIKGAKFSWEWSYQVGDAAHMIPGRPRGHRENLRVEFVMPPRGEFPAGASFVSLSCPNVQLRVKMKSDTQEPDRYTRIMRG